MREELRLFDSVWDKLAVGVVVAVGDGVSAGVTVSERVKLDVAVAVGEGVSAGVIVWDRLREPLELVVELLDSLPDGVVLLVAWKSRDAFDEVSVR